MVYYSWSGGLVYQRRLVSDAIQRAAVAGAYITKKYTYAYTCAYRLFFILTFFIIMERSGKAPVHVCHRVREHNGVSQDIET